MFFFTTCYTGDRGAEEDADDRTLCLRLPHPHAILHLHRFVTRFHMSAPVRLYATRSSVNPAVTVYNALAEDLAVEASGSTPAPLRSKWIKAENYDEMSPASSSAEDP